jgi:hypothetical protein
MEDRSGKLVTTRSLGSCRIRRKRRTTENRSIVIKPHQLVPTIAALHLLANDNDAPTADGPAAADAPAADAPAASVIVKAAS